MKRRRFTPARGLILIFLLLFFFAGSAIAAPDTDSRAPSSYGRKVFSFLGIYSAP